MGTLFVNGTIITASDVVGADVLVEGEKGCIVAEFGQKVIPTPSKCPQELPQQQNINT